MGTDFKSPVLVVAALAMVGVVMFFAGRASFSSPQAGASASAISASGHAPVATHAVERAATIEGGLPLHASTGVDALSVASAIAMNPTLGRGFEDALARFGPNDPDLISAANEAVRFCAASLVAQNADERNDRAGRGWADSSDVPSADFPYSAEPIGTLVPDPRQTRAREQLVARCAGFDAKAFLRRLQTAVVDRATAALLAADPTQRLFAARAAADASQDRFALSQAGHILIEHDQLPLREIFAGEPPVGKVELIPLWWQATALATCASQLGCGPDSLTTLAFCAQHICDPGVNYQQALAAALSPRDFRTVSGFSQWIRTRPR